MSRTPVYCDYNATTPVRPAAIEAAMRTLSAGGNASSLHEAGRAARASLETARERIARVFGARERDVVFTSGATEAIDLALDAAAEAHEDLVVSSIEHDAVWQATAGTHAAIRVDASGVVDLQHLDDLLCTTHRPLVAVMLANNETGVIQPVAAIGARVREAGGLLLVDASQAAGRIPVDMGVLDATYLVVSSHKLGGPPGAGALILAPGAPFAITRRGGGQEQGRRPGTENVPAIAGFAAAFDGIEEGETARIRRMRDDFERGLRDMFADAVIFGADAPRLANTSLFALPETPAERALIMLDLEGVAVSSGAACSSGKVKSSRILAAMGVGPALAQCALRASFGWASTEEDGARLLAALSRARARAGVLEGAA
jgi:cysteine desulfurase